MCCYIYIYGSPVLHGRSLGPGRPTSPVAVPVSTRPYTHATAARGKEKSAAFLCRARVPLEVPWGVSRTTNDRHYSGRVCPWSSTLALQRHRKAFFNGERSPRPEDLRGTCDLGLRGRGMTTVLDAGASDAHLLAPRLVWSKHLPVACASSPCLLCISLVVQCALSARVILPLSPGNDIDFITVRAEKIHLARALHRLVSSRRAVWLYHTIILPPWEPPERFHCGPGCVLSRH